MNQKLALSLALTVSTMTLAGAQTAPASSFTAADVHTSPRRSYPFFYAVLLPQDRYVVRDATMLDMIATAWGLDRENVQGGPSWLEWDRFDVIAKVPWGTPPETLHLMLRTLLEQRFHLVVKDGMRPMPVYVLSVDGKPKLNAASGTVEQNCESKGSPTMTSVTCRSMTLDRFAQQLRQMAGDYLDKPIVNSTALDGAWDIDFKWTLRRGLTDAGTNGITIFDALENQLGLKLALQTTPRPVLLVKGSAEAPTANAPALEKILPPRPVRQFEVATIKPSQAGTESRGHIGGDEVNFKGAVLRRLIDLAWDLNEQDGDVLAGAPKWLDEERFDVLAKVSTDSTGRADGSGPPMDIYAIQMMLQALLVDRFQMKTHMEDRPVSAYTLVAVNPKLKPAEPGGRTQCKEGPGPDGKDPRIANPALNRLVTCRNMTMPEIGEELQQIAPGYVFKTVADGTVIKGSFDFTLSFSADRFPSASGPANGDGAASEPSGAITIFDAVNRQLGLKLEKQKRSMPVLVIDHVEQKPKEN